MGLTRADGPLAPRPPATVNYSIDGPAHKLMLHPFPRRVRAVAAGRTVLDTVRGALLHETALPPRLYVPLADLDDTAFEPSTHTTHCPFKGDATYRTLRVEGRVVENALWAYPDPLPAAPWLAGLASLYWEAADLWLDEDDPVVGRLPDPFHRVDVRASSRTVQVMAGDAIVAESASPLLLTETGLPPRWYLSIDDVRVPLESTGTRTLCPYKGEAHYWSARLSDGQVVADAFWGYPDPLAESLRIAGRVCTAHPELTVLVDGEPAAR